MPVRVITEEEGESFLVEQRVLRVCAQEDGQLHLIPLGYIWLEGSLYGGTISQRLVAMIQENPHVASQIDNYAHATGPWAYRSITGKASLRIWRMRAKSNVPPQRYAHALPMHRSDFAMNRRP
ncbi:MAG: pyridoxamine 5'-phosphate oxidase family protein [Candidatus Binatia bacterium]